MLRSTLILVIFSLISINLIAQDAGSIEYLNSIGNSYGSIRKDVWNYTRTIAHSKSARKIEKNRIDLIQSISKSQYRINHIEAYEGNSDLKDTVAAFLDLYYKVLNDDFKTIVDMEAIAEQSYDNMEAYITAQEIANEKLNQASLSMDNKYKEFANNHGITLNDSQDKLGQKLQESHEALSYYNKVYLIFFRAHKQESDLLKALNSAT